MTFETEDEFIRAVMADTCEVRAMNRCWKCNDTRPCNLEHCGLKEAAMTAPEKFSDIDCEDLIGLADGEWHEIEYRISARDLINFVKSVASMRDEQWQIMLSDRTPSGYATCNDDGDITMMWRCEDLAEARTYCGEGEEPIPLYR
jgi:hypothetical protein